ncbi:TolC family outer membrane protein [Solimonas marina]|uniref:TolC family outer membrane protein n=1 Tax=Solimonas marina TaxID=2714601 RepID=A0A969W8B9_9GAMM|nr:TolC family outer membrane protein [Solimonas marina]NKF21400.1 TolC family outer membrane protein [Solimonas marina]
MSARAAADEPSNTVDLLTVCNDALELNPGYESARAGYYAAKELVPQARGKLLPQLGALASYSWRHDHQSGYYEGDFEIPDLGLSYDTRFTAGGSDTFTRGFYGAQLTQALYKPALLLGLDAAKLQQKQAELALGATQDDLLIGVVEKYFAVLAAKDADVFSHAETAAVKEQLDLVSGRAGAGLATQSDLQTAQAAYQLALADQVDADNALVGARLTLESVTGKQYAELKVLPTNLVLQPPQPLEEGAWIRRTKTENPSILSKQAAVELAKVHRRTAQRARYPQVDLVGTAYDLENTGGVSGAVDSSDESIGVRVTMPLYTGGQISSAVKQGRELEAKAEADQSETTNKMVLATRIAFLAVATGTQRLSALKRAVQAAADAEDAARAGYNAGTRDNTDVLNAVEKRYASERDYAAARYKFIINSMRLKQLSGNLLTADLATVNRLLERPEVAPPPTEH